MMDAQPDPQVEAIDFRLMHCKAELERIHAAQDELLARHSDELRQDFANTRYARLLELTEMEKQNYWILQTWLF